MEFEIRGAFRLRRPSLRGRDRHDRTDALHRLLDRITRTVFGIADQPALDRNKLGPHELMELTRFGGDPESWRCWRQKGVPNAEDPSTLSARVSF